MAITLSETAAKEVRSIIDEQVQKGELKAEKAKLRVGVKGGGCSGFGYSLELVEDDAGDRDEMIECHGVKILCDQVSMQYLEGVEIDWRDEVTQRGFTFRNPNATHTCGCGSSFHV